MRKNCRLICAFLFTMACCSVYAAELGPSIREAERLYQAGRYDQANQLAREIHRFYPGDLQTLLVLGMSSFNSRSYLDAKKWFRLAAQKSPKHPLVIRYSELLREIEYRSGPLSQDPEQRLAADELSTARYYKRGFFGPSFNLISKPASETRALATATVALPTSPPPSKPDLSEMIVADMAQKALEEGDHNKAFLFYTQLSSFQPSNRYYLMGKARAAFHMKRYKEVIEFLGPMLAVPSPAGFSVKDIEEAKNLLKKSRQQVFNEY